MITWENEPWLKWQHIKGTMVYHKGRVVIMGGTGLHTEGIGYDDHPYTEWLNQNGVYNEQFNVYGTWVPGVHLPLTIEEASAITDGKNIYVFGIFFNSNLYVRTVAEIHNSIYHRVPSSQFVY